MGKACPASQQPLGSCMCQAAGQPPAPWPRTWACKPTAPEEQLLLGYPTDRTNKSVVEQTRMLSDGPRCTPLHMGATWGCHRPQFDSRDSGPHPLLSEGSGSHTKVGISSMSSSGCPECRMRVKPPMSQGPASRHCLRTCRAAQGASVHTQQHCAQQCHEPPAARQYKGKWTVLLLQQRWCEHEALRLS